MISPQPVAVVNFRQRIKQLLWHPKNPDILLIVCNQKEPLLYIWHTTKQQLLVPTGVNKHGSVATSNFEAQWFSYHSETPPLLLLSSPDHYDAGMVDVDVDSGIFCSILNHRDLDDS